jgi:DNA-binding NarL/FixJ family response regulator
LPSQILIADDHGKVRSVLKSLLESHADWQVCGEAANGVEAVQKAAELKPDLIILDLAMPVMDGLQAARNILSASPTVPILIHTNHAFSSLALEAKKNGVRMVVNKGASGDELFKAVETLLSEKVPPPAEPDSLDKLPDPARQTPETPESNEPLK